MTKVLITNNGGILQGTEIIDVVNEDISCESPEDYPFGTFDGVGTNLAGNPVVCGGYDELTQDNCFILFEKVRYYFYQDIQCFGSSRSRTTKARYSLLSNKRGSTFILFEEFVTPPHLQSPLHVYFSLEIVPASTFIATLHIF